MYVIGKRLEYTELFNLVVEDENFADWLKNRLSSDNEMLEEKLSNLESLKTDVGVSYKNGKMKLLRSVIHS